ncbi:MAG: cell division protein FtsQ/DivIB [Geminicoccaceae bacterium]
MITLAAITAIGGGYAFLRSPMAARWDDAVRRELVDASVRAGFVVRRVYSEGRMLADEAAVSRALQSVHGKPLFSVELSSLRSQIEALPWVRTASIGRRLPDTLWVRLEEYRPVARWMDGSHQVLVSDAHEVFRVKHASRYKELPLLFGKGAPARADEVLRLIETQPELASHVTGARLVGERRWDVYLDGRIEVRLPGKRPEAAWRRLAAEERESGVIKRAVTSIDLRNPDWLTLEVPDTALGQEKEPRA